MKKNFKKNVILTVVLVLALVLEMFLAPVAGTKTVSADDSGNPDPNFHIYIAFGQSNMEGNPKVEAEDLEIPDNYYMMQTADNHRERKVGEWYPAVPPLANNNAQLSLVDYFGRNMVYLQQEENPDIKIGLIVVAVAGTSIQGFDKDNGAAYYANSNTDWLKGIAAQYGGDPYKRMTDMAKLAQKDGVIKGFLMHQGESDGGDPTWPDRVKKIYNDMLADLELGDNIPLLVGQTVGNGNQNIKNLTKESDDNFYEISSEGFNGDVEHNNGVHFTAAENRAFGLRYAEKMLEVQPQYTWGEPVYEWSADNTTVKASRVCNELPFYIQEETVNVTKKVEKEAAIGVEGSVVYTSDAFQNAAFTQQTKTEKIPALVDNTPVATPTPDADAPAVEKVLKVSAVKCKKNAKKITGKVSEKGATVKIKVGKKAAKKATVKGKKFTLKLSYKLKKKTKVTVTVTKKDFKQFKKTYTVK